MNSQQVKTVTIGRYLRRHMAHPRPVRHAYDTMRMAHHGLIEDSPFQKHTLLAYDSLWQRTVHSLCISIESKENIEYSHMHLTTLPISTYTHDRREVGAYVGQQEYHHTSNYDMIIKLTVHLGL